jgi:hypothetical protein
MHAGMDQLAVLCSAEAVPPIRFDAFAVLFTAIFLGKYKK